MILNNQCANGNILFCEIKCLEYDALIFFLGVGGGERVSRQGYSVEQAGLELRNLPASASQALGLKAYTTTARLDILIYSSMYHEPDSHLILLGSGPLCSLRLA